MCWLLNNVAEGALARRYINIDTASISPDITTPGLHVDLDELRECSERLGLDATYVRPPARLRARDLRRGGPYDLVLTTDLDTLQHVRAMGTENKGTHQVVAFNVADFLLDGSSESENDVEAAIQAVVALPAPLRSLVAESTLSPGQGDLGLRVDLPRVSSADTEGEEWRNLLAVGTACSLGFTARLKQSIRLHARHLLMRELLSLYPTAESLRAAGGAPLQESLAGGLSAGERQAIVRAYEKFVENGGMQP